MSGDNTQARAVENYICSIAYRPEHARRVIQKRAVVQNPDLALVQVLGRSKSSRTSPKCAPSRRIARVLIVKSRRLRSSWMVPLTTVGSSAPRRIGLAPGSHQIKKRT